MFKYFTASAVVFNKMNEILLVKHKRFGLWIIPGGQLNEGEAPHEAAVRETLEETGIKIEIIPMEQGISVPHCKELPRPFAVYAFDIAGGEPTLHDTIYISRAVGGELSTQFEEVDDAGWFSYDEFKRMETFENTAVTVAKAVEYITKADEEGRLKNG